MLRSATRIEAQPCNGGYRVVVYMDINSMDNYYQATDEQVATWANEGLHGGFIPGNSTPHVWDDTIENTIDNGELLKMAKDYLRKAGFTVV